MIGKRLVVALLFGGIGFLPLIAQQPQIAVSLSQQSVSVGGTVQIQLLVEGFGSRRPDISVPDFSTHFDILSAPESTSVQMINGDVQSQYIKRFVLRPRSVGRFELGPFSVISGGQRADHPALLLVVEAPQQQPARSAAEQSVKRPPIFLESRVSTTSVYVGEPVLFSTTLFTRYQLSNIVHEMPNIDGVWMEDLTDQPVFTETIGGQPYRGKRVIRRAIFPLREGDIIVPASRVGFVKNFFEGQTVLETDPTVFHVKPLPEEGQPEGFTGVVGDYTWRSLSDQQTLKTMDQNVPATVRFEVSGSGYLGGVKTLEIEASDAFTVYPSKVEDSVLRETGIEWTRIYEYLVVPKVSGRQTLPVFSLAFFSPKEGRYVTLQSEPLQVQVSPGNASADDVEVPDFNQVTLGPELSYLRQVGAYSGDYASRVKVPLGLLCGGVLVLVVMVLRWGLSLRQPKGSVDQLKEQVIVLRQLVNKSSTPQEVLSAVYRLLSIRVELPVSGLSLGELRHSLLEHRVSKAHVERWLSVVDALGALGYQPGESEGVPEAVKTDILALLEGDQ